MDNAAQEKLRISGSPSDGGRRPEKPETTREVHKKTSEVIHAAPGQETVESQQGVEFSEGKVSEASSEDKAYAPAAGSAKNFSADEIEAIRAKLLAALPTQEVMMKQIRKKLNLEEKALTKRLKRLRKKAHTQAFQLTIIVAQLRKIREYFSMLVHATYEMIKHLWLKIVHGV